MPRLATAFQGRRILLTGSTGFVGKVVLATFLEKITEVGKIVCLVRASNDRAAEDRFLKDVIASGAFDAVRAHYGLGLRDFVREKLEIRAGDVTRERLGLDEASWKAVAKDLDLIIHCAGLVDFVPPLDKGLAANVDGTQRVIELAKEAGKRCAFLHVSTCFVAGERDGHVPEDLKSNEVPVSAKSGFTGFDAKKEIDEARKLVQRLVTEEVEDPLVLQEMWKEADGNPRKAKRLAEIRAKRRLVEEGWNRARKWGWPNTYCYTKALAERLVDAARPDLGPVAIVRPAVVESAIAFPVPGWNQGVNTCAPLMWMNSRGMRYFPIPDDHVLDVIPVDLCVNGMILVAAALLEKRAKFVYQLGSSARNPLALRRVNELTSFYYKNAEIPEAWWQRLLRKHAGAITVPYETYERFGVPGLARLAKSVRGLIEKIPAQNARPAIKDAIESAAREAKSVERQFEHAAQVIELYMPFVGGSRFRFRIDNVLALESELTPEDRALFRADPAGLDWRKYFLEIFIPGLERWTFPELKEREGSATDRAPLYPSLVALLEDAVARGTKRVALKRVPVEGAADPDEEKLTYDELLARVEAFAGRLIALGVKAGDRVALVSENRPFWVVAYFGTLRAGATCVPVDAGTDAARLVPIVRLSRAKVVVGSPGKRETLSGLADKLKAHDAGAPVPVVAALEELCAPAKGEKPPVLDPTRMAPATLIYTSGTTGAPKGVLLSHSAFAHQVHSLSSLYPLGNDDRVLSVLPLHHAFEFTCGLLLPLVRGATITYAREPNAEAIKAGLLKVKPTCMIGVPALFEAWHRQIRRAVKAKGGTAENAFDALVAVHRGFRKRTGFNLGTKLFPEVHAPFGGELKYAVSGGAALAREVTTTFHGLGIDLYEGYGLTEAAPVVCSNRPADGPRGGVVGPPIPGVEVKIHEPDGEGVGEILVKSPSAMDGYDQDPKATANAFLDGWLRTGDLGRVNERGQVAIVGRSKDVIVDGAGNTVYPDEVEELYQGCPDVAEIAVAGVPLRDGKEAVGALVLTREEAPGGAAEARERVRAFFRDLGNGIPNAKRVKVLRFANRPLPRTATRKVKRDEISRILQDLARGETSGAEKRKQTAGALRGAVGRALEEVAGIESEHLSPESDLAQDLGLDSIAVADVIASLVESTGRPAPAELGRFQSVADLVRYFEEAPGKSSDVLAAPVLADPRPVILPDPVRKAGFEAVDAVVRLSFSRGFQTKITGQGNIPRHTQAIVVANHSSHLDAPLVRYALGAWGKRLVAVGARDYFFKDRLTATYFENFTNVVAFDRRESIRESLARIVELLEAGHNVLIFPEGTRSVTGRLQAFKPGLGYLVATSGVGVLPIYLAGTYHAAPKGSLLPRARKLEARIGGYMPADLLLAKATGVAGGDRRGAGRKRDRLQRISDIARDAIVALRDGVPYDLRSVPDPEPDPEDAARPRREREPRNGHAHPREASRGHHPVDGSTASERADDAAAPGAVR